MNDLNGQDWTLTCSDDPAEESGHPGNKTWLLFVLGRHGYGVDEGQQEVGFIRGFWKESRRQLLSVTRFRLCKTLASPVLEEGRSKGFAYVDARGNQPLDSR